jgi:hypothetical protein
MIEKKNSLDAHECFEYTDRPRGKKVISSPLNLLRESGRSCVKGYGLREHLYGPKGVVNTLLRGFVSPTSAHPFARLIQVRQKRLPLRQPKQVQLSQRQSYSRCKSKLHFVSIRQDFNTLMWPPEN